MVKRGFLMADPLKNTKQTADLGAVNSLIDERQNRVRLREARHKFQMRPDLLEIELEKIKGDSNLKDMRDIES
jgi:hypothetical protein